MTYDKIRAVKEGEAMENQFSRSNALLGEVNMEKLKRARVAIFGVGGVGGYAIEALARSGIGEFLLVDKDTISITNINRQIIASHDTLGMDKIEAMKQRILSINPNAKVEVRKCFFLPENKDEFDFSLYDYVIDAVDTVTAKIALILKAKEQRVPIISAMGAGNKINPSMLMVSDIYNTSVDPLAKVLRGELKKRRVNKLKVVYSKEKPMKPLMNLNDEALPMKNVPASLVFVPAAMGLIIASEVVKDLTGIKNDKPGA